MWSCRKRCVGIIEPLARFCQLRAPFWYLERWYLGDVSLVRADIVVWRVVGEEEERMYQCHACPLSPVGRFV